MTQPTGLLAYWPTGLHELAYWVPVVWPLCAEREGGGGALVGGVVRLRASAPLLRTDIACHRDIVADRPLLWTCVL